MYICVYIYIYIYSIYIYIYIYILYIQTVLTKLVDDAIYNLIGTVIP